MKDTKRPILVKVVAADLSTRFKKSLPFPASDGDLALRFLIPDVVCDWLC